MSIHLYPASGFVTHTPTGLALSPLATWLLFACIGVLSVVIVRLSNAWDSRKSVPCSHGFADSTECLECSHPDWFNEVEASRLASASVVEPVKQLRGYAFEDYRDNEYFCNDCADRFAPDAVLVDAPTHYVGCEHCHDALTLPKVCPDCNRETAGANWWRGRNHNYICGLWAQGIDCMCGEGDDPCYADKSEGIPCRVLADDVVAVEWEL